MWFYLHDFNATSQPNTRKPVTIFNGMDSVCVIWRCAQIILAGAGDLVECVMLMQLKQGSNMSNDGLGLKLNWHFGKIILITGSVRWSELPWQFFWKCWRKINTKCRVINADVLKTTYFIFDRIKYEEKGKLVYLVQILHNVSRQIWSHFCFNLKYQQELSTANLNCSQSINSWILI